MTIIVNVCNMLPQGAKEGNHLLICCMLGWTYLFSLLEAHWVLRKVFLSSGVSIILAHKLLSNGVVLWSLWLEAGTLSQSSCEEIYHCGRR